MRALGYCRVSTMDQAREGVSLDNQQAKIQAYCKLNGFDLVEIIRDEGLSGKTLEREGMVRLLGFVKATVERDFPTTLAMQEWSDSSDLAKALEIDAIIVYKLDRLS